MLTQLNQSPVCVTYAVVHHMVMSEADFDCNARLHVSLQTCCPAEGV